MVMVLLFVILYVKLVLFCVLDEVEVVLDEVNVVCFVQYLWEFFEQIQFIVVIYWKGIMEEVDVLYGVIMEEGGVLKFVLVRLEDEEVEIVSV